MTAKPNPIAGLVPAIRAVADWLRDFDAPSAIIGGIAAGLLGRARNTIDVDAVVLVDHDRLAEFVASAARFGIVPRIDGILEFAAASRVLLLKHVPSKVEVDVSLAGMPFEEELLERAVESDIAGVLVRLPTVEDLIVMKGVANRPRDWADIEGLIDAHPDLDAKRVLLWSRRFAEIMETPEVVEQLEKLLHAVRPSANTASNVRSPSRQENAAKSRPASKKAAGRQSSIKPTKKRSTKKAVKKAAAKKAPRSPRKKSS